MKITHNNKLEEGGGISFTSVPATASCAPAISYAGIPYGKTERDIASKLTINAPTRTSSFTATSTSNTNSVSGVANEPITIKYNGATTDAGGTGLWKITKVDGIELLGATILLELVLTAGVKNSVFLHHLVNYPPPKGGWASARSLHFYSRSLIV